MKTFTKSLLFASCILSSTFVPRANAVLGEEALTGLSEVKRMPKHSGDLFPSETLVPLKGHALQIAKETVTTHMDETYSSRVTTLVTELSSRLDLSPALVNEERVKVNTGGKAVWTNIDRRKQGLDQVSGEGVDYEWVLFPGRIQQLDDIAIRGEEWLEAFKRVLDCSDKLPGKTLFAQLKTKSPIEVTGCIPFLLDMSRRDISTDALVASTSWPADKLFQFSELTNHLDEQEPDSFTKAFTSARQLDADTLEYLSNHAERLKALVGQRRVPTIVITGLSTLKSVQQIADFLDAFEAQSPTLFAGYEDIADTCPRKRTVAERKAATLAATAMLNPDQITALGQLTMDSPLAEMAPFDREPIIRSLAKLNAEHYIKVPHLLTALKERGRFELFSEVIASLASIPLDDMSEVFPLETGEDKIA